MQNDNKQRTTVIEILLLAVFVLAFRMVFEGAIPFFQDHFNLNFNDTLMQLLRNYPLALLMCVLDFLLVWLLLRYFDYGKQPMIRSLVEVLGLLFIAFGSAFLLRASVPEVGSPAVPFFTHSFWYSALTSFIFNAVIIGGIDIYAYYRRKQKQALDEEIGKKNKARYQYQQLKRQLNPHFLFNSLNSLDYLIRTDADKASAYVRKLASVYRYLLNIEEETLVPLRDEVAFVTLYVELLSQRFDKGLQVSWRIEEADMRKKIIPCGLQLLVENATKHNVISVEKPLIISIYTQNDYVVVVNNLQPKIHKMDSTGVGISNIKGQYFSVFGKEIIINQSSTSFEVRLPLLD